MGSCAAQTFTNITSDRFAAIQQKAAQSGINITGNSGQTNQQGFTFSWQFDPTAQTLTIQCLDHPFFAPCGTINGKIHDLMDGTAT